jgi:hypothetical protein
MKRVLVLLLLLLPVLPGRALSADAPAETNPEGAVKKGSIVVRGTGSAPADETLGAAQKRIMALRAAKVVALREAAEVINGVTVSGATRVSDMGAASDEVKTTVDALIKGARVVREAYDPATGVAEVYVAVPLSGPGGLYAELLPMLTPLVPDEFRPYDEPAGPVSPETGVFDGLIIDVRGLDLRPALINRVLTENGYLLYDPSRVSTSVLERYGAALYTDDPDSARRVLRDRGSINPLVVKAVRVERSTDAVISPIDASRVFSADQSGDFLSRARVVFVLR